MGGEAVFTNILWRIRLGGWDDMTSANIGEVNAYGTEGQVYYVPRHQYGGTRPLYRLRSPHSGDHMDSMTWNEGGYANEGVTGYPYASSSYAYGLSQYTRTYSRCNGDHGNRSYWEGPKPCYVDEPQPAYGWSRFLNAYSSPLINSAGGVTIESNRLKGGSLVHWTHNGTQYLNNFDAGRQMQSAVFYPDGSADGEANPTEGGDRWTDQWRPAALRHGSPVLMATTDNHPTSPTQSTRSIPIDYEPQQIGGGPDNPVVYKDQILGKDIQLNWRGFGPVARYHTRYLSPAINNARIEIPTGYVRADFNRFFIHDANSGGTAEIPRCGGGTCIPNNCSNQHNYFRWAPPNRGGVIIANGDGSRAMGVYGANVNVGGSVSEFYLATFFCGGSGDELSQATSKWSAIRYGNFGNGTKAFNTWVLSGTLDVVRANMNRLAAAGDG